MTNGTDILLLIDNDPIAALTSNDFNCEVDVKDITSKDSAGWRECKPMKKSFNGSANGFIKGVGVNLVKSSQNLANANNWQKSIGTTISSNYGNSPVISGVIQTARKTSSLITFGSGILVDQVLSGISISDVITYSVYLKGTGKVNIILGDDTSFNTLNVTLSSTWTRYSLTRTIVNINPHIQINKDTATTCEVDCIMVNQGSTALPYTRSGYTFDELYDLQNNGTKITMLISDQIDGNKQYSGYGYIKSLKHTDPVEDTSTFTCSIEGTADLSKTTI